jgi:vitamin B12 transporter
MPPILFLVFLFSVRGVVLDPTARPIPAAQVSCGSETSTTDANGRFEFQSAASCDATISKPGFAPKTAALSESSDNQITLTLAPASDRVVVTATGSPLALEEAGVAADVFTARDFETRQFPFLQNVLRDVAGLNVVQTGRNGGITSLFARGGGSNTSLVLLDGIPITEPGGGIDFAHLTSVGLDRMEVIRGPESALFGAEASSAVIQIFTRHGDPETRIPHGSISYERGSFSTDHWTGSLDGGLMKRLDYALTADQFRATGEFPNDAYRITTGTANLGYRFSDATTLRAVFRTFDSYTGVPGQVFYGLTNYSANASDRDAAVGVHLEDARGRRYAQRVTFGYHRYRDRYLDPTGLGPYDIAALIRTIPDPQPRVYLVRLVDPSTAAADPGTTLVRASEHFGPGSGLTITNREDVAYQGTVTHRAGALVFGYDYQRQAGVISNTDVARYDNGLFVHEQYALTPRVFLSGGARFEHSSTFGSKFAPRGAVTFRLPADTFFRLSAARGIKEPELIENFARESFYVGNPSLRPEKTDSYEAGVFREWFSRRLRTEVSVFRNSFQELIVFDFSTFPGTWQNADRSWARGAEVSGILRLARDMALRGTYTKLYTRITRSNTGDEGQELVRRPRNSGSISLELTPRRWTLIAGGRFVGERQEQDFVFPAINRNPGYQYVFVNGSWQATRHVAPFLRVENALDAEYQEVLGYSALSRNVVGGVRIKW